MKKQLELADAQFIGFHLGKWGADIRELVSSMGLTKEEWNELKLNCELTLDEEEKLEVDKIFEEKEQISEKEVGK